MSLRALPAPGRVAVPITLLVGLVFAVRAVARRRRTHARAAPDPAVDAWLELEDALLKRGLRRAEHETPLEFASRLVPLRAQLDTDVRDLAVRFCEYRYGDRAGADVVAFGEELRLIARSLSRARVG